jgi:hypothetical protein
MLAAVTPGAGLLLRDAVRRRRDLGQPGGSSRPDPAPLTMGAVRDLPAIPVSGLGTPLTRRSAWREAERLVP